MKSALLLAALLATARAQGVHIGVVEPDPQAAWRLAAAAEAALAARADEAAEVGRVEPVVPEEPLAVPAHVCAQATRATAALAGGGGTELAAAAAARAGLPLLLVQPARAPASWEALALYPHEDVLAEACVTLVREKGWRRAVLLHSGSARPAALVAPDDEPLALLARQLPTGLDDAYLRNVLLVLKKAGETNFIVWCDAECAVRVLDGAQRVGLLSERHSYILLTLELHTRPLHDYSHGGANVTGLMLFDPDSTHVREAMRAWRAAYRRRMGEAFDPAEASRLQRAPPSSLLLAYDGVTLLADALSRLRLPEGAGGDCERGLGAFHADTLLNHLRATEAQGTTGVLAWEADGRRRGVALRVVELERGGRLEAAGVWASGAGVTWTRRPRPAPPLPADSLTNRTFKVLIAKSDPYVMRRESTKRLTGNERYEGFCIELIDKLATMLGFNYTFVEQEDGKYGEFNETTKEWNGMVRRLRDDPEIDFAITDLTITAEREKGVDFTTPFMNLGISILFRKPKTPEPALFAFLLPFSNGVWLCLGLAYVGTSLVLYVVGRLCPEEWQNPYPCIEEPPALENQFTLANAFWFNLGAVLLQGSEIAPVAYGTRAVASVWWVFALVITSSYTANLASLLATKSSTELIHNARELADNQLGIKYGAKSGGSTFTFFEHSQFELYQKMFKHMNENLLDMPGSNGEGIKKVKEEDYAFLMESTTIEYTIERNCAVTMVGDLLDSKGYGIAMKKNSTYRQALNLALLNLQETGVLREMKHLWWKEKHGGGACNVAEDFASVKLEMRNFLGLFLVLVVGCALGVVLSCANLAWTAARHPRAPDLSFGRNFLSELRFVFRFERSEKPVRGPLSEAGSASDSTRRTSRTGRTSRNSPAASTRGSGEPRDDDGAGSDGSGGRAPAAGPRMRRRSSMHNASLRLARHAAAARDSATPRS